MRSLPALVVPVWPSCVPFRAPPLVVPFSSAVVLTGATLSRLSQLTAWLRPAAPE